MTGSRFLPFLKIAFWRGPAMLMALGLLALLTNAVGIWALGDVTHWLQWVRSHRAVLTLWRILLYGVIVIAWIPTRRKVISAEPNAAIRLMRVEVASAIAIILIEAAALIQT